ncbi:MAG: phospholipase [Rickettsiales bacterium]|jgi:phospholipase/carboxylesterase|nr:phospholipase [Rickettsiales bacterium]
MPTLPPTSGTPEYLAVLFHGYGERGEKMIRRVATPFSEHFPSMLFIAPDAPFPCKVYPEGFDWLHFDGEWTAENIWKTALQTEILLNEYINGLLAEYGLSDDRLVLIGFSQGGALAMQLGLRRPKPCHAVIAYGSPMPIAEKLLSDIHSRPPMCLIHGAEDSIVPPERHHMTYAALKTHGIPVTGHLLAGTEHRIDPAAAECGIQFLKGLKP